MKEKQKEYLLFIGIDIVLIILLKIFNFDFSNNLLLIFVVYSVTGFISGMLTTYLLQIIEYFKN
ncbi:hypothetical protein AOC36_00880 [Erysipelothrix larvae]|uniref:Uncharacterized protein n=1 Tax=Erysipelothrix larvae TaxID=1514105 RepID=A0A109UGG5_9FIRM|nr:hypothetical protein [Erysipelothrix larvae]AMC92597.1 hypothetical protein AOC36_00880 [Erysipelothrix larvae]